MMLFRNPLILPPTTLQLPVGTSIFSLYHPCLVVRDDVRLKMNGLQISQYSVGSEKYAEGFAVSCMLLISQPTSTI
jgi:hypothetical protein